MRIFARKVAAFFASSLFFRIVLGIFVFEALWVVFSARYPMAFDEDFHLGVIKIYAQHWLPFLPANVEPSGVYGPLSRDPSFLFHYLMSFPYRLIAALTGSLFWQVVFLRLIDVGMVTGALVLFRKFMLRTGVSRAFTHVTILLFVLIPVVPLLAGQINYDNLVLLLVAWLCLLMAGIIRAVAKRQVPLQNIAVLLIVCLAGSLVKYAFLPIAVAAILVLLVQLAYAFWGNVSPGLWPAVRRSYRQVGRKAKILLAVLLVIFAGLFVQRYGVNLVRYHTPVPDCAQVLTVKQCQANGPWARNYGYRQNKQAAFHPDPVFYTQEWFRGMWKRLFFVINGNFSPNRYQNVPPLPLPPNTAAAIAVVSLVLIARYVRRLFARNWLLLFAALLVLLYVGALFFDLYKGYAKTGAIAALNGRYLLLVLLPAAAIAGRAWEQALGRWTTLKTGLAIVAVILFLQGGLFEFIVQSNQNWYWQHQTIVTINQAAGKALRPLAIGN